MARLTADLSIRPQSTALAKKPEPREHVTLLIDNSGSMSAVMDNAKQRIHNVVDAIIALTNISDSTYTAYSLVTFESHPRTIVSKTVDYLDIQTVRPYPAGGTMMNLGISQALQLSPHRIILLSDGEPTCQEEELWSVVETAKNLGVKIDTIAIGAADTTIMEEIATRTGGKFQQPKDATQLTRSYLKLESKAYLRLEDRR